MRLGGEGQAPVGVGGRGPGPLGKHLVPYPVQEGGIDPAHPHQVLDAPEGPVLAAVVHDADGHLLREAAHAHELSRGGRVDVDARGEGHGGDQVVRLLLRQQVPPQGAGRVLRRAALAAHADLKLDLLQLGGTHAADQGQVLHLLEATDVLAVLHDAACHRTCHPRQGHQLLLRGRVDVEPLLIHQDVAEVAGRAELAAVGQVRGVPGDGAVAAQGAPHGRPGSRGQEGLATTEELSG